MVGSCLSYTLLHVSDYIMRGLCDHLAFLQGAYHLQFHLFTSTRYLLQNTSSKSFSVSFYSCLQFYCLKKDLNKIMLPKQQINKWRPSLFFSPQECSVPKRYFFFISTSISSQNKPSLSILALHKTLPPRSPFCSHKQSIKKST